MMIEVNRHNFMGRACKSLDEVVSDILQIVDGDKASSRHDDDDAEYFFRGVCCNWAAKNNSELGPAFEPTLDRYPYRWRNERDFYQEALRLNVASFTEDRTMAERIARMQHYGLPTRFADLSINALQAALFAAGGCDPNAGQVADLDGFIRVVKVAKHKMKSFTSDIIVAISHLPLVNADDIRPNKKELGYLEYEVQRERPGFSLDSCGRRGISLYDEIQQVWAFKPLMNNPRIRNQGGLFLAFGCRDCKKPLHPSFSPDDYDNPSAPSYGIAQVGFVRIAAKAKSDILNQLRMFGMTEESVYPDLQNVCQALDKRFSKLYQNK